MISRKTLLMDIETNTTQKSTSEISLVSRALYTVALSIVANVVKIWSNHFNP